MVLAPYAHTLRWPTNEMRSRGQAIQLIFGAVVAALSGAGVALAESNANVSSVVGTAIAAALLPPTVNCGICLAYALIGPMIIEGIGEKDKNVFFEIAVGSALLVWINIIFIYLSAVLVFKIKQIGKFQLIRKVDEGAWRNLPRLQRTPLNDLHEIHIESPVYDDDSEMSPTSPSCDGSDDVSSTYSVTPDERTAMKQRRNRREFFCSDDEGKPGRT